MYFASYDIKIAATDVFSVLFDHLRILFSYSRKKAFLNFIDQVLYNLNLSWLNLCAPPFYMLRKCSIDSGLYCCLSFYLRQFRACALLPQSILTIFARSQCHLYVALSLWIFSGSRALEPINSVCTKKSTRRSNPPLRSNRWESTFKNPRTFKQIHSSISDLTIFDIDAILSNDNTALFSYYLYLNIFVHFSFNFPVYVLCQ